jgi:probable HAF family extracellular repeat protein
VMGANYFASGQREAFRWTSAGGVVGLGDLPGGTFTSEAYDVSADGSVIVGVGSSASGFRAFRWTSDGGMVHLGDPPGGWFSLGARAVSADGSVVVGAGVPFATFPDESAIYWTADGGMRALWDVLLSQGVNPAADGWTSLGSAEDISADGNTIVGYGIRNGNTEAFVAVVPEPSALLALPALRAAGLLRLRRRRVA